MPKNQPEGKYNMILQKRLYARRRHVSTLKKFFKNVKLDNTYKLINTVNQKAIGLFILDKEFMKKDNIQTFISGFSVGIFLLSVWLVLHYTVGQ